MTGRAAELLEQAEAALEGVTEGPWTTEPRGWLDGTVTIRCGQYDDHGFVHHSEREAAFIAAARSLVPELAASLRLALTVVEAARPFRWPVYDHEDYPTEDEAMMVRGQRREELRVALAAFDRAGTDTNNEAAE